MFCAISITASAQPKKQNTVGVQRPKLVVGLVVDQMRWDYLYRYYDRYQQGGFKRMLNEGFTAENTQIDYIPTVTAIGHATIYTGSVPAIHGIAGNDFIMQQSGKEMYCTEDESVQTVGSTSDAGKMSPRNMLTSTITDELRLATNFRSKVIGIALKDRGAILPAGHSANAAYWFDDATGGWISSTFYMKELPQWVQTFNATKKSDAYLKQGWNTLYPLNTYQQSTADDSPYEGKFLGQSNPVFPINLTPEGKLNYKLLRTTPYGNSITLDMARAAIENERLGKTEDTDFLAVSLSSTDYVGHQFGPNAVEVEDMYLRLDRDLADFFSYLDQTLGKGSYTVFLSADHGAAHNPNFLKDQHIPAGFLPASKLLTALNAKLEAKYQVKNLVISLLNYQVHFDYSLITANKLNEQVLVADCIDFFSKQDGIAYVVDQNATQLSSIPEVLRNRIINGYNQQRSGAIQIVPQPAWFSGYANTGTTHAVWNPYDSHIPFVMMGWGVKPGKSHSSVHMTDIAPTLAALLRIQMPNGSIGKVIAEALK